MLLSLVKLIFLPVYNKWLASTGALLIDPKQTRPRFDHTVDNGEMTSK